MFDCLISLATDLFISEDKQDLVSDLILALSVVWQIFHL